MLVILYYIYIVDAAFSGMDFYVYPFWGLIRGLPYLLGALHFLYAKKLISPEEKLSKYHLLHFSFFEICRWLVPNAYDCRGINLFLIGTFVQLLHPAFYGNDGYYWSPGRGS